MQALFVFPEIKTRKSPIPVAFLEQWSKDVGITEMKIVEVTNSPEKIKDELFCHHAMLIVVCGGTGLGRDNFVPQCLAEICDYEVPGIGEMLRTQSAELNPRSRFGRGGCWIKGESIYLAVPGGSEALAQQLGMMVELIPDMAQAMNGQCRPRSDEGVQDA